MLAVDILQTKSKELHNKHILEINNSNNKSKDEDTEHDLKLIYTQDEDNNYVRGLGDLQTKSQDDDIKQILELDDLHINSQGENNNHIIELED